MDWQTIGIYVLFLALSFLLGYFSAKVYFLRLNPKILYVLPYSITFLLLIINRYIPEHLVFIFLNVVMVNIGFVINYKPLKDFDEIE